MQGDEQRNLVNNLGDYLDAKNYTVSSVEDMLFALDFFQDVNNPNITFEQFVSYFLEEYQETSTDLEVIDPDLITFDEPVVQASLPSFNSMILAFPKLTQNGYYYQMPTPQVYNLVGGSLLNSYLADPDLYGNACSIRGSRGLLYSGIHIPVLNYGNGQRTQKGADGKNYILDAVSFDKFMVSKFGEATHKLTGADANNPTKVAEMLKGKTGIYVIVNSNPGNSGANYSGHVDLIINGQCIGGEYTTPRGGVKSIRIWILN
ncbi:hypothetical protein CHU92_06465 [Flavobacterium cyanobacteriorum]|uniref:Type VI secretion system amidase effector protein Tae4 n=2 Tax=Flavobacterium cyanobacteriorum TaxID=2022802 RepID=A0A255Z9N4_9FLAO|nr:hypothetical protein CHU92_06465 [Flavobacterium cyanobacteriorum]